ncbi:MAG: glycosyltransferase family A protein [Opitutaceae bacterium]|jgi:glycosyltransferase involved in cell wall biosynthesis
MNAPPLVSIVMPAFNAARWLPAALDSALAQTYPHFELIVVDDGSSDDTPAILENYRTSHGIRVITQTNQGQSAAANRGLAEARGDYVKFFDADDVMSPGMLAAQVAALANQPGCVAYGTWGRFHDHPDEAVFVPHPGWHDSPPLDWIVETWADTEPMYQCALFLLPRELLRRAGGWDARLGLINDFEFFTRLVLNSRGLVFTPDARLHYRSGLAGSLSRTKSRAALASGLLSNQLAIAHLLAVENSPRTRRLGANLLQNFVYSFYPSCPDLAREALAQASELGGSSLLPRGGRGFKTACRLFGWRAALALRSRLGNRRAA